MARAGQEETTSELPLTEDFFAAAEKRVTPDNYRLELVTIQRELDQLQPKPSAASDASEHALSQPAPTKRAH